MRWKHPKYGFIHIGRHFGNFRNGISLGFWFDENAKEGEICWRFLWSWYVPMIRLIYTEDYSIARRWTGRDRIVIGYQAFGRTVIFGEL